MNKEIIFNYKIDIKHIDEQHERLIDIIQSLIKDVKRGATINTIINTIDFMSDYIVLHFKDEEQLLRKNNYKDYEEHRKLHQEIIQEVNDFKVRFIKSIDMATEDDLAAELSDFAARWILDHILNEDMKYVPSITE